MVERSAGVLFHRGGGDALELLLVHPGGPYWRNKDAGAWQIPKGGIEPGEDAEAAARREVREELGVTVAAPLRPLGAVRQAGGKLVEAFACRQEVDADAIVSSDFALEWPPRSGRMRQFPEVDRARWFTPEAAADAILASQKVLIARLATLLDLTGA